MLRKSYARRPNKAVFWGPLSTLGAALATAGLWPMGLLLCRLWFYASHQRFRAGELRRWMLEGEPVDRNASQRSTNPTDPRVAPVIPIWLACSCWLAAL